MTTQSKSLLVTPRDQKTNKQWVLQRTDKDGYTQQIVFTGFLSRKPKGWIVIQQLPAPATAGDQS